MFRDLLQRVLRLRGWETLLLVVLVVVVIFNIRIAQSSNYLTIENGVNLFQLHIEKIIIALMMTFIIINGEIDLSVASVMGLAACLVATLYEKGTPMEVCILIGLAAGALCGLLNGFCVAYLRLPSLAVTLAGLIGYRGLAQVFIEDRSVGNFPQWFADLGQKPLIGPFPFALIVFAGLVVVTIVVLQYTAFGRYVYVIGNNREVARFSGVKVRQVKLTLFVLSSVVAAFSGILYTAHLGAVRGSTAQGFELDIITMVLLGGVSIFGGKGTLTGVGLSILIVLNLRNGMGLSNITANTQTIVIGTLLILSVLIPHLAEDIRSSLNRRRYAQLSSAAGNSGELGT